MAEPVRIWKFVDAPDEMKKLSAFEGKEDWAAHVPPPLVGLLPWIEPGKFSAVVSRHPQSDGSVVYIGARS